MTLEEQAKEKKKEKELRLRNMRIREFQSQQIKERRLNRLKEDENELLEAEKVALQLAEEDELFREFAVKEMEKFKDTRKKKLF